MEWEAKPQVEIGLESFRVLRKGLPLLTIFVNSQIVKFY